jgi:hypothetical protein
VTNNTGNWNVATFDPLTNIATQITSGSPPQPDPVVYTFTGFRDSATPILIPSVVASLCPTVDLPSNVITFTT